MNFSTNAFIVDTFMSLPDENASYEFLAPLMQGKHRSDAMTMPANYLFKDAPSNSAPKGHESIKFVLDAMDKHSVNYGFVDATNPESTGAEAVRTHPNRFGGTINLDPNMGMDAVYFLEERVKSGEIVAAFLMPAFVNPQTPINDKKWYPIYAKCSELGIPVCITTGIPGPRVPMFSQHIEALDEVCWFFPDLKIVMRHGAEPWVDIAIKLMLKWPNLYYSTSAFAPKHYPKEIIKYANQRGANKIIYAGYFPVGLTLDRIFSELPLVPFKDEVWPKFLAENAIEVFGLNRFLS